MISQQSLGSDYFAKVYAESHDPWNFATSPYERSKYDATIAALGGKRFSKAFEVGCSIGVLTARLAQQCADLLAIDINDRALDQARERCAGSPQVRFERMAFPRERPSGPFDLVVVSEVGYYWSDADLAEAIDVIAATAHGGTAELVHFLPRVDEYLRDGDAVHAAFLADSRFKVTDARRTESYRIDVLAVS